MSAPAPFMPVGPEARWRTIYNALQPMTVGEVLTYEVMGELLDLDPVRQRSTIIGAQRKAAREMLLRDARTTESVRGIGYRIVEPARHLALATGYGRKSRRALQRGTEHVEHVDWAALDNNTRLAFESQARVNRFLAEAALRLEREQNRMQRHIDLVTTKQSRTDEEVRALRDRLHRLETGGGFDVPTEQGEPAGE